MKTIDFFAINRRETARRINQLRHERGLQIRDIQEMLNFHRSERLDSLTLNQLAALSILLDVRIEDIIVQDNDSPSLN